MENLTVTYRVSDGEEPAMDRIHAILLEQTVETPSDVAARYPYVREKMLGSVREVVRDGTGAFLATLSLPFVTASVDPAQFLNVLFGNSSLHQDVTLVDFEPPPAARETFSGPAFGVEGIRELLQVPHRPLTCSALKPVGLSVDEMVVICRNLAEGGIDLIKDDHYLADQSVAPYRDRVRACQDVVDDVYARTGRRVLYVPNLSGTPDSVKRQAVFAQSCGVGAVMIAPMLLGMPLMRALTGGELGVPLLAHPSFGGAVAIRPAVLFGKLFRLFGADAVIFANYGGRFSYPPEVCSELGTMLRAEWLGMRPSFPVPAGGMDAERAPELVRFFGLDTILLVGGSLLEAGSSLREKTEQFTESVRDAAEQALGD